MSAQHNAGIELCIRIGQRVRHQDYSGQRVTGMVQGLSIDSERVLQADIVLDAPIIISASGDFPETRIHRQYLPAHELAVFDERDELIAEMLVTLIHCATDEGPEQEWLDRARAVITKVNGGAV